MTNFAAPETARTLQFPSRAHRGLSRALGLALAMCAAIALSVLWAVPASAHAQLLESDPPDGEQLDEAPASVELTFNEHIEQIGSQVVITDADGNEVQDGDPLIEGPALTQDLLEERPAGEYTVQWRVVSADGHPVSGEFTFQAAAAAGADQQEGDEAGEDSESGAAQDGSGAAQNETEPEAAEDDAAADAEEEAAQQPAADPAEAADDPAADDAEDSFPWGLLFALAGVGVVLALVVRARRQIRDQTDARAAGYDQDRDSNAAASSDRSPDEPGAEPDSAPGTAPEADQGRDDGDTRS